VYDLAKRNDGYRTNPAADADRQLSHSYAGWEIVTALERSNKMQSWLSSGVGATVTVAVLLVLLIGLVYTASQANNRHPLGD
jgi:hypothetical protein